MFLLLNNFVHNCKCITVFVIWFRESSFNMSCILLKICFICLPSINTVNKFSKSFRFFNNAFWFRSFTSSSLSIAPYLWPSLPPYFWLLLSLVYRISLSFRSLFRFRFHVQAYILSYFMHVKKIRNNIEYFKRDKRETRIHNT